MVSPGNVDDGKGAAQYGDNTLPLHLFYRQDLMRCHIQTRVLHRAKTVQATRLLTSSREKLAALASAANTLPSTSAQLAP
jgi:hypothetical protein